MAAQEGEEVVVIVQLLRVRLADIGRRARCSLTWQVEPTVFPGQHRYEGSRCVCARLTNQR
jgi:hypothetical protein